MEPQELHVPMASERASLVKALSTVALLERRRLARRFLQGLSIAELRYIAGYLGACLLEAACEEQPPASRGQMASDIMHYECCLVGSLAGWRVAEPAIPGEVEHKMILLLEYLSSCRCGATLKVAAGSA